MRKRIFALLCLVILSFSSVFAVDRVSFKNPGGVKVFHKDGQSFYSPEASSRYQTPPDTNLIQGDAIKTGLNSLSFKLDTADVTLSPSSLMSFYQLSDNQYIVYLINGEVSIRNTRGTRDASKEFIVLTPTSRFSQSDTFSVVVRTDDDHERVTVNSGRALAFNYINGENVAVNQYGYIDFLEEKGDNFQAVASTLDSSSAMQILGINPSDKSNFIPPESSRTTTQSVTQSVKNRPDAPEILRTIISFKDEPTIYSANIQYERVQPVRPQVPEITYATIAYERNPNWIPPQPQVVAVRPENPTFLYSNVELEYLRPQVTKPVVPSAPSSIQAKIDIVPNPNYQPQSTTNYMGQGDKYYNTTVTMPQQRPAVPAIPEVFANLSIESRDTKFSSSAWSVSPGDRTSTSRYVYIPTPEVTASITVESQPSYNRTQVTTSSPTVSRNIISVIPTPEILSAKVEPESQNVQVNRHFTDYYYYYDENGNLVQTDKPPVGARFISSTTTGPNGETVTVDSNGNPVTFSSGQPAESRTVVNTNQNNVRNSSTNTTTTTTTTTHTTRVINNSKTTTEEKTEEEKREEEKPKTDRIYGGVELGLKSSIFDKTKNVEANKTQNIPNNFIIFAKPYITQVRADDSLGFLVRLNYELGYSYSDTDGFKFELYPQVKRIIGAYNSDKTDTYYIDWQGFNSIQKALNSGLQFIDDIVVPNYFYMSRNFDLPLEYNNYTLRKHLKEDNLYLYAKATYNAGNKKYNLTSDYEYRKKIPFLLDFTIADIFRFRAYAENLEMMNVTGMNLSGASGAIYNNSPMSWANGSSRFAEMEFKVNPVEFGFGSIFIRGDEDATNNIYTDKIYLTANVKSVPINNKFTVGLSAIMTAANYVTDTSGGTKHSISEAFTTMTKNQGWGLGVFFNIKHKNIVFDVGADFSAGQLFAGLLNKKESFRGVDGPGDTVLDLYSTAIPGLYAIYPYINMDFDWGLFAMAINADMPIYFGNVDDGSSYSTLATRLKSWSDLNFFYRLNAGLKLKLNISDIMKLQFRFDLDDIFPLRAYYLGDEDWTFKKYLNGDADDDGLWTWWNIMPEISFSIDDGPISLMLIARHQRINLEEVSSGDKVINKTYTPIVGFESSVKIGNDYIFNPDYIRQRKEEELNKSDYDKVRFIFNLGLNYNSAKSYDGGNASTVLSIIPRIGLRYKNFKFVAKFDFDNFSFPKLIYDANGETTDTFGNKKKWAGKEYLGNYFDSLIDELNIFDYVKLERKSGLGYDRNSVVYQKQFYNAMDLTVNLWKVLRVNVPFFREWINGFMNETKSTYFDVSLGYMDYNISTYINFLADFQWGEDNGFFVNEAPISLNNEFRFGEFYSGLDFATTIGHKMDGDNKVFSWGFDNDKLDAKTWEAMGNISFGYSKKDVADFIIRLGFANGGLAYLQNDHLTTVRTYDKDSSPSHIFRNQFQYKYRNKASGDLETYQGLVEFADILVNVNITKEIKLTLWYDLPMALIKYAPEGFSYDNMKNIFLTDRASIMIDFNYPVVRLYGLAEMRGVIVRDWESADDTFKNPDNFAFKAGMEFKADYANFIIEAESAHFIYGAGAAAKSRAAFALSMGVNFGFF